MTTKIIAAIILLLLLIQFIRIDKTNPSSVPSQDLIYVTSAPGDIASIIKTSCYDCHSNQTKYPWYTNLAPISWFLKHHINEAREHMNFSEWGSYPAGKQNHKLGECYEELEEGDMPLFSYTLVHGEARLNDMQQEKLETWFKQTSGEGTWHEEDEDDD